ncbi:MAG: hypothetical protein ABSH32_18515 [Bryobacteraceae bacterium]|jgi:aldehyde dehydrogenase (NAD+)
MDTPVFPNYIDGQWIGRGPHFENRNPARTDEIVGLFAKGTARDIEDAADMTHEEGKTLPEAKGEVRRSINIFRRSEESGPPMNADKRRLKNKNLNLSYPRSSAFIGG